MASVRRYLGLMLAACLLVACSSDTWLSPLNPYSTILAFGASLTYGTGASPDSSYPKVLSNNLGMKVVNGGVPGEITENGLKRLPGLIAQYNPDLVLISHGGNDILKKVNADVTKSNLREMIRLCRESGADVVLIAIPQPALLPSAAPFYMELGNEMRVPVEEDIVTRLQKSPKYKSDPIHFNAEGYRLLAEAVQALLEDNGAL